MLMSVCHYKKMSPFYQQDAEYADYDDDEDEIGIPNWVPSGPVVPETFKNLPSTAIPSMETLLKRVRRRASRKRQKKNLRACHGCCRGTLFILVTISTKHFRFPVEDIPK